MENKAMIKQHIKAMADKWPSTVVCRSELGRFSGGFLHPRTMANIDSRGEGPERLRVGKKTIYAVDSLIEWWQRRIEAA